MSFWLAFQSFLLFLFSFFQNLSEFLSLNCLVCFQMFPFFIKSRAFQSKNKKGVEILKTQYINTFNMHTPLLYMKYHHHPVNAPS